ncbi:MAG: Flp pilus assembly protein CpaB, partial [Halanaerobacter sp.]
MNAKMVVIIAIILGLITSVLVYTMLGTPQQQEEDSEEKVSVVVAKDNIKARQKINEEMVELKKVPQSQAHYEALNSVEKVEDRYVSNKIIAGEQILKSRLYAKEEINSVLAFNLDTKKRAVTVAVNEVTGVAGFLIPGDYVDVVGVFSRPDNTVAKTVLQNVKVLAVAQDMTSNEEMKAEVKKSVTLAVDLKEAEKLVLADREGKIRLALRSPNDKVQSRDTTFNLDKLVGWEEKEEDEAEEDKVKQDSEE